MDPNPWLDRLEHDLKRKADRQDSIGILQELADTDDPDVRRKVVWCAGKFGQNKVRDERILRIIIPFHADPDPQIREDVAWGIGESSGAGSSDERMCSVICALLSDDDRMVRAMAAWAAGRLMHKLGIIDDTMIASLKKLKEDDSEYVRNAADFALNGK